MKARVAWYTIMQCSISDEARAASGIVGFIDRCSFWLSVIMGIGAGPTSAAAVFPQRSLLGSQAASSFLSDLWRSDEHTRRIGDQRWRAHRASPA
jgi:hypothetical protein